MPHLSRRQAITNLAASAFVPGAALAQVEDEAAAEIRALWSVMSGRSQEFQVGLGYFLERGTQQSVPGLILAMRHSEHPTELLNAALVQLSGVDPNEAPTDWFGWMLWQQRHPDVIPNTAFAPFKRAVLMRIDPAFEAFLQPQFLDRDAMRIRLEEVTWGGVAMDGLVPLDAPNMVAAGDAIGLRAEDLVFGAQINGQARAYPLRILGWHEMMNDVIDGLPVALAYCPLCGSGALYKTGESAERRFVFGSSGLLYRSNKLMFDRQTYSLWSQFTGTPVMGPLAPTGFQLPRLPLVTSTWQAWAEAHPETTVLSLETGFLRDYGPGAAYRDYVATPDLMFPAAVADTRRRAKDWVLGLETQGAAKAWPLSVFEEGRVLNDRVGALAVVLLSVGQGRGVRAYARGETEFSRSEQGQLIGDGETWTQTEAALIGPAGQRLERVPTQIAYWFAWAGHRTGAVELFAEESASSR